MKEEWALIRKQSSDLKWHTPTSTRLPLEVYGLLSACPETPPELILHMINPSLISFTGDILFHVCLPAIPRLGALLSEYLSPLPVSLTQAKPLYYIR